MHDVQIRDRISPQTLYVNVGDEVRWQNLRDGPVNGVSSNTRNWTRSPARRNS